MWHPNSKWLVLCVRVCKCASCLRVHVCVDMCVLCVCFHVLSFVSCCSLSWRYRVHFHFARSWWRRVGLREGQWGKCIVELHLCLFPCCLHYTLCFCFQRWLPVHTVESILISVISMFSSPNDESPANIEAAVCTRTFVWDLSPILLSLTFSFSVCRKSGVSSETFSKRRWPERFVRVKKSNQNVHLVQTSPCVTRLLFYFVVMSEWFPPTNKSCTV